MISAGINYPENEYGIPPQDWYLNTNDVYGNSNSGYHFDFTGIYMFSKHVGLAAKGGIDINQSNSVKQYLGGFYFCIKPKQSKFNVYFLTLIGEANADIPTETQNDYGNIGFNTQNSVPGIGSGIGFYGGIGISAIINRRFYFNLSLDYLSSDINFPNGAITTIYNGYPQPIYNTAPVTTTSSMQMDIGILQANLGISYHF